MNRNEFIAIVAPVAVRVRREGGPLFPSILMAQTLLETGGKIPEWNNIVGYKVGSGKQTKFWRGRSVNTKTREVINGVSDSNQRADWRVYDSVYDCLKDQALLFKNNPERYQRVIDAPDPYTQADALYACGYATDAPKEIDGDPDYAEKLRGIIPRFEYLDVEAMTVSKFKMKYEITSRYLSGPSKRRPCIPMPGVRFLVAHDTGNPGSTAAGNVSYYERSRNDVQASAHLFVDDQEIIECIPLLTSSPEKAWHVVYNVSKDNELYGCNANDAAGGVELCYGPRLNLHEAYKRYIWVLAYACYRYGLNPAVDITGHHILDPARKTDPMNAFQLLGKTFEQFICDVVAEYQECTKGEAEEPMLNAGVANTIIDTWMSPAWKELDAKRQEAELAGDSTAAAAYQQQAEYIHWLANEMRKASGQPAQ